LLNKTYNIPLMVKVTNNHPPTPQYTRYLRHDIIKSYGLSQVNYMYIN